MVGGVGGIFGVCRVGGHDSGVVVGVEVALLVTEGVVEQLGRPQPQQQPGQRNRPEYEE